MQNLFEELYDLLKEDRKYCGWAKECTLEERFKELHKEVIETKEALDKGDVENFQEELGDVLWDVFATMIIAEEKGFFDKNKVLEDSIVKFKKRKPWVLEKKELNREESITRYQKYKKKDKEERGLV